MGSSEEMKADLVVVGAGAAGMTAAVAAAEAGVKRIILLESRKGVGGNGNFVLGMFAAESKVQKFHGIECRKDDVFKSFMKYHHWKTNPRLVRALVNKTADTIEWLEKQGVVWGGVLSHFPGQTPRAHHYAVGAATTGAAIMNTLRQSCDKFGATVMTETRATKLLIDKGRVIGVKATAKDKELTISAQSVIVATGGMYGNEEMIQKSVLWPQTYEARQFVAWGLPLIGDGIAMLTEAGAAREGRVLFEMHAPVFAGELKLTTYVIPISHITMWVNKNGERFADETISDCFSEGANAVMRQPDKVMYCLFDENIKQMTLQQGYSEFELVVGALLADGRPKDPTNIKTNTEKLDRDLKTEEKKGFVKIANSWDEIARYIGASPEVLKATVEEYNSYCDKGHDDDFAKDRQALVPLRKPPFYAMKCAACINTVHGDIKCNHRMNVLNKQDQPIVGLYAAGVDTGGADWHTYDTELTGHSFGFSVNSGRIAGESAAKLALGK